MAKRKFRFGGQNLVPWLTVGCMVVVLVLCVLIYKKVNNEGYTSGEKPGKYCDEGQDWQKNPSIPSSGWSDRFISVPNPGGDSTWHAFATENNKKYRMILGFEDSGSNARRFYYMMAEESTDGTNWKKLRSYPVALDNVIFYLVPDRCVNVKEPINPADTIMKGVPNALADYYNKQCCQVSNQCFLQWC